MPLATALRDGLAPDGGLYVPTALPPFTPGELDALRGRPLADVAAALLAPLVADALPAARLRALLADALDFPIPLVTLAPGLALLELFHGPTLAFKDIGARTMARLLAALPGEAGSGDGPPLTVLVATSGDTGGAVAHAFHGVAGTRVVVLYPDGQVSPVQEAQFTTLGGNVTAVAVAGTFDDCQRLVKQAFGRPDLRARARLTSANSINVGRLLPQMVYYAWAVLQLPAGGPPPVMVVPSGNFGNLVAGLLAWRMGVPVGHFVAATTVNDVVPQYLATGRYLPRPSVSTLANAMDVGDPSNFERMRWLFDDDLAAMRAAVSAAAFDDAAVRAAIAALDRRHGYVADPHTAIGYLGAEAARAVTSEGGATRIVLATAHPAKFREAVEPALGRAIPLPLPLAEAAARPRQITRIAPDPSALGRLLEDGLTF